MDQQFIDDLNNYYKLKSKYEDQINSYKKKLANDKLLTPKERKTYFKKFKPQCINCKRPVTTSFSINYDSTNVCRNLYAICGDKVTPCPLNININLGFTDEIGSFIRLQENMITDYKNQIIKSKNDLLFNFITADEAVKIFDNLKEKINEESKTLTFYIDKYYNIIDNNDTKKSIEDLKKNIHNNITKIKDCVISYNNEGNTEFINDAVDIYINSLLPLLKNLSNLKYKKKYIEYDGECYNLIQKKYDIEDIEDFLVAPTVESFVYETLSEKNVANRTRKNRPYKESQTKQNNEQNQQKNKTIKIKPSIIVVDTSSSSATQSQQNVPMPTNESKNDSDDDFINQLDNEPDSENEFVEENNK